MGKLTREQALIMSGYIPLSADDVYSSGGSIDIKDSKKGTFTAAATKHGKSVQGFASQVLANKDNYSPAMVKKANFARNASKWKHQDGGAAGGDDQQAQIIAIIQAYAKAAKMDPQDIVKQIESLPEDQKLPFIQSLADKLQGTQMQEGGPTPEELTGQEQPQGDDQLMQGIQQALQQGATPEELIAELIQQQIDPQMIVQIFVQLGMPQEQVVQVVQSVMEQMGGGQEQEVPQEEMQMQEQGMEEPMQESMEYGGVPQYPYGGLYDKNYAANFMPDSKINRFLTNTNMLSDPSLNYRTQGMAAAGFKPAIAFEGVKGILSSIAGMGAGLIGGANALFGSKDAPGEITAPQAQNYYSKYFKNTGDTWAKKMENKHFDTPIINPYGKNTSIPSIATPPFNPNGKKFGPGFMHGGLTRYQFKGEVKDERVQRQVTKDNLEDRNVFSQNQLSFKKPVVQKQIKQVIKDAANPKVVVFAESPKNRPFYDTWDDKMPKELEKIRQEIIDSEDTLDSVQMSDKTYKDLFNKREKLWTQASDLSIKYGDSDYRAQQAFNNAVLAGQEMVNYSTDDNSKFSKKILPYINRTNALYDKFDQSEFNPKGIDSTFYKEAKNVEDFYKKTDPNTKVDIVSLYGDNKLMQRKLKGMSQFDKVAIFGHSGDKLAGIANNDIAKYLSNSRVNDCYFGSCGFESQIKKSDLKDIKGKTLNYRPSGNMWLGFNPNAQTFDEGMWSRNFINERPQITPINLGESHITNKLEYGGLPEAQFGIPGDFDFNDPYGLKQNRFGQTANYADTRGYGQNPNIDYDKLNNFSIGSGINDNASLSYGDPYAVDGVNYQVPKQTTMTPVSAYGNGVTPYSKTNQPKTNSKTLDTSNVTGVSGNTMYTNAMTGLAGASDFASMLFDTDPETLQKRAIQKANQDTQTAMLYNPKNPYGERTPNAGILKPNMRTVQDVGSSRYVGRYGGATRYANGGQMQYQQGGEYHVTHDELLQLMQSGAQVEFL